MAWGSLGHACAGVLGLARVRTLAANMFEGRWPEQQDAVWLSDIFRDWPEPVCAELARRAIESPRPGGRVLVNEVLLEEGRAGPLAATAYELALLLSTSAGRQYTLAELGASLQGAGFVGVEPVARAGVFSVVAGRRPSRSAKRGLQRPVRNAA
jgi:hypothetical protein